jgi:hypothetical protein
MSSEPDVYLLVVHHKFLQKVGFSSHDIFVSVAQLLSSTSWYGSRTWKRISMKP